MNNEMIKCSKCGEVLPKYMFCFRKDTNKYRSQCKKCNKGYVTNRKERELYSDALFEKGLKRCGMCGEEKELTYFNFDKYTRTGYTSRCKNCLSIKTKIYRDSEQGRRALTKKRYNISDEEFDTFISIENCEICGIKLDEDVKVLDHNHKTIKYRGALCWKCNVGIGFFNENIESLKSAILYLTERN